MANKIDHRRRRGTTAIEFALWLPVLFILISAVVDWGYYMSQRVSIARATMDGCRIGAAVFEPNTATPGSVSKGKAEQRTREVLAGLGLPCGGSCAVIAQYCADGAGGACGSPPFDGLIVQTHYEIEPFFGLASAPTDIDEDFMMAVENQRD